MLHPSDELRRMTIHASDGEIGRVSEFYFDDEAWTVRYFIVRTGHWLAGREVLLPPARVRAVDWTRHELMVGLTMDQVRNSPDVSTEQPVSRLQELEQLKHYGQPAYWMLGAEVGGAAIALDAALRAAAAEQEHAGAPPPTHLRSSHEVMAYGIEAADGGIGHVTGFLIDDATWRVEALLVDTSAWWSGTPVTIPTAHVTRVSWGDRCIRVSMTRDAIRSSPAYHRN
jgi:hypothetical protein